MTSASRPRLGLWLKRIVISALACAVLLAGLLVGGVRLLNHFAPQYGQALAARLGRHIGARVHISGLELGWGWHGPILYLDQPRITQPGATAPALSANRLGLQFSLSTLLQGARLPDGLEIDGLHASFSLGRHGLRLDHWSGSGHGINAARLRAIRRQLNHVHIENARLTVHAPQLPDGRMRWSGVDLALDDHHNRQLQLTLTGTGPSWWPNLSASASIDGRLDDPERARFSVHSDGIQPPALLRRPAGKLAAKLGGGRTALNLSGHWRHGHLAATRLRLQATALTAGTGKPPLLPAFTAGLTVTNRANTVTMRLTRLRSAGHRIEAPATWARFDFGHRQLRAHAARLPSQALLRLAHWLHPGLTGTRLSGRLDNLSLHWQPGQPLATGLGFRHLTVNAPRAGFGPVSGDYRQQGDRHQLVFSAASGQLRASKYLRKPLAVSDLRGAVSWQRQTGGARVFQLHKLRLVSGKASLTTSGRVRLPAGGGDPVVDLTADAEAPHVARLLASIPQGPGLPNPRLRQWLPRAIKSGALDHAHLEVKGPMARFPFASPKPGNGFHMTLQAHGVDVRYKSGWPMLRAAAGQLRMDGDHLTADLSAGRMLDVPIATARAEVADIRSPVMQVRGEVKRAPAPKLLSFLADSPLRNKFGKLVKALHVDGPDDVSVQMRLPLKPGLGKVRVQGRVDAHGNTLHQASLAGPIRDIRGTLTFNGRGLSATGLKGRFLGIPIDADLAPAARGRQQITAHAYISLPLDRDALAHYLPPAWLVYARGSTPVTLRFTVDRHGKLSPIRLHSQLSGLALRLPAPLAKKAAASAALAVTIDSSKRHIKADYDQRLRLQIDLGPHNKPRRIAAMIGNTSLKPPDRDGLWVGGHSKRLDALGWFEVVRHVVYGAPAQTGTGTSTPSKSKSKPEATESATLPFVGGDLRIDHLAFGDHYIADTHIRARPLSSTHGWHIDFEGHGSRGQLSVRAPADQPMRLAGHFQRIALHTRGKSKSAQSRHNGNTGTPSPVVWQNLTPTELPALKLSIQNFLVDGTSFGEVDIDAKTTPDGWSLDRLALTKGALTGHMSARWQQDSGRTAAQLHAGFDGHGLARLMRIFGYVSPVRARRARIKADLAISPNSRGLDLRHLNGQMYLGLDHGTLLSVDPGPARLLGLLNLYVLPRRLRLDFRDVVDKGMAFDKVRAHFRITHGQAYSKPVRIITPSARIGIAGRIGLAARDYDEKVTITPKVSSSVAIASTVLGGPLIGAAVFAVQQLLKKPIQQFSSISYTLKGSWDNPEITNPSTHSK